MPPASADDWASQATAGFRAGYTERPDQQPCTLAAYRTGGVSTGAFKDLVAALEHEGRPGFLALLDGLMLQRIEAGDAYRPADLERRATAIVNLLLMGNPEPAPTA